MTINDDRCRVRSPNGQWILGMVRRLVVSLYLHWRAKQLRPQHLTLTDFQSALGEDNLAQAMTFVTHSRPKLASSLHAYALNEKAPFANEVARRHLEGLPLPHAGN